ncbi:MAG: zonular occludens toxin domain-containing protein [Sulfurospirillum sp.]
MIIYLVGVPGAGKTYYAVNEIFEDVKSNKHQFIYTNIDQFDFKLSSKIKKFDFEEFQLNIIDLYNLYKDKDSTDDDLIDLVKKLGYYKTLFVIDESHNFFDALNPVFVWLFSYHRHIFIDFLLITQNLALIDSKYKKFAEYFIRAVPTTLLLFSNTFKYRIFIDSRMSAKSQASVKKLKKSKEIFDLYHSGDSVKSPNVIKKYLIYFLIGVIIVSIMFHFVTNFMKGDPNVKKNVSSPSRDLAVKRDKIYVPSGNGGFLRQKSARLSQEINNNTNYYYITCSGFTCTFKNYDFVLTPNSLAFVIKEFTCSSIFKETTVSKTSYLLKCQNLGFLNQFTLLSGGKKNEDSRPVRSAFFKSDSK